MKKIVTLVFFAFALILGTQSIQAQSLKEINNAAAEKTRELQQVLKFNQETSDLVYELYKNYEQKMANIKAEGGQVSEPAMVKIQERMNIRFKEILTEEQYARYLDFIKTKK